MQAQLPAHERRALLRQRALSRLLSPLWIPAFTAVMAWGMRWRIRAADARALRAGYARLRAESPAPLLICANHLTMTDSFLIGWALGGARFYLRRFDALPWNTPETRNFASTLWKRALAYVLKCIPIERGADRRAVAQVLARVQFLLARGEAVLIFPEGGRSRSGRVEPESAGYGAGRLVHALPGCRVLCVYLRGEGQQSWSEMPARGETFRAQMECFAPQSAAKGLRGSLDISRQIIARLQRMEGEWFRAGK